MKFLLFLLCPLLVASLHASYTRHELPEDNPERPSLIYYVDTPEEPSFPLALIIQGSYDDHMGPQSILGLHDEFRESLHQAKVGLITLEKRGIDGDAIDVERFHQYNFPSQRLADHKRFIDHLRQYPPRGWNGQLAIIGGSEGGPIAIKLAHAVDPAACIVIVGCGDQSFQDYIWQVIEAIQTSGEVPPKELPATRQDYEFLCAHMKQDPNPQKKWFGQTFRYWADALDQTEHAEFLSLRCPILVIAGSQDIECQATDRLIAQAKANQQGVVYSRIEGMDHRALDPQWKVKERIVKFLLDALQSKDDA